MTLQSLPSSQRRADRRARTVASARRSLIGLCTRYARETDQSSQRRSAERVPLGLIRSSWGGTKIREWSSAAAIAECTQAVPAPPGTTTKLFANMILPLVGLNFKAVTW